MTNCVSRWLAVRRQQKRERVEKDNRCMLVSIINLINPKLSTQITPEMTSHDIKQLMKNNGMVSNIF